MSIVSWFTLDLYCDGPMSRHIQSPKTYSAETEELAKAKAEKDGWLFGEDDKCLCPKCVELVHTP